MTRPSSCRALGTLALASALSFVATAAIADPCEADLPRPGTSFEGPVRYVGDGDMLCVEVGGRSQGSTWIEVRVADFSAPELNQPGGMAARDTLRRIAMGRRAVCSAGRRSYDRVVAVCRIGGVSVGDLMRQAGVDEGGR